jgi:hypothetical protein
VLTRSWTRLHAYVAARRVGDTAAYVAARLPRGYRGAVEKRLNGAASVICRRQPVRTGLHDVPVSTQASLYDIPQAACEYSG